MPPKLDVILADMDKFVVSESVTSMPTATTNKAKTSESEPKSVSEPLIKDWESDSEDENETETKSKHRKPSFAKIEFVKPNEQMKSLRKFVKQEKHNRKAKHFRKNSQSSRGIIDSGYSRHMTRNMSNLFEYEKIDGGYVAFGEDPKGGKITGKGKITTDTEYIVLSPDFKLLDESQVLLRLCEKKRIKRELSVVRTSQQNEVAERKNRTLIEAARTMLADLKLPTTFWTEAVNTACYVQKRGEEKKDAKDPRNEDNEALSTEEPRVSQEKDSNVTNTNNINTVSLTVNAAGIKDNVVDENIVYGCVDDLNMPNLEEIIYSDEDEDVGAEAHMTNLDTNIPVNPIPTTRIHKDHPVEQIIGDIHSTPQTRRMTKNVTNYEGIDYDEVFALLARIEAIRLFLAYASFKDFVMYQMDMKSAFLYGKIEEEVYVCQPLGFKNPKFPNRVYKVEKALYSLHQASRAWYETVSAYFLDSRFQRDQIDKTLFIKRVKGDILLVQVYVYDIIFGSTRKDMCTEFEKMMHKNSR
nr:putative ribonuclease H-like domain-containing protein [Tanacetum cinerariifolium]